MSRSFGLRDIPLVAGLEKQGVLLDLEERLLGPQPPLGSALLFLLTGTGRCTYVLDEEQDGVTLRGFLQGRDRAEGAETDVVFLAPALGNSPRAPEIWHNLLAHFCGDRGQKGAQRVFVKVPGDGNGAADLFREMGFGAYARRTVFRLVAPKAASPSPEPWRPRFPEDDWGITRLYSTVTPRPVQRSEGLQRQREGPPGMSRPREYVVEREGETIAFLRTINGRNAHWMKLILHPQVEKEGKDLLRAALALLPQPTAGPVYCGVREYEVALKNCISDVGFEPLVEELLMVKHTVVPAEVPEPQKASLLEKKAERITPVGIQKETLDGGPFPS